MPGRGSAEGRDPALDSMVFGAKRKPSPANDANEPDFLPPVDSDEADFMMARANADRRGSSDRRQPVAERRQTNGRRATEYAPLRDGRADRSSGEDGRRGPMLLIGALLIVVVFAVVVWNAYSDGVQTDQAEVAPELSTAGAFKTPPREVPEEPIAAEPVDVAEADTLEPLAGAPIDITGEQRATPTPPPAKVEAHVEPPAVSKVTAAPPPTLKAPVAAKPVQTATVQPAAPKPVVAQPVAKVTPALAPTPIVATAAPAGAYKPSFAAYGDHVVQIAATSSQATAEGEWTKLKGVHGDLLSGAERFIQQADVNGRTVYRLRVGSFASKADAAAFCTAFKARGGNCYPAVK